jgi:YidC/Oxa1 family membrane protein insertase
MDKQGFIVIGLILAAWMGWQWNQARLRAEWIKTHPEALQGPDGTAPEQSSSVAAPETRAETPVAAPPQDLPKHEHVVGIPFETPQHLIELNTLGASLDTLTLKEILDTSYVARAPDDHDDARAPVPFLVLRPFRGAEAARSLAVEPLDPKLAEVAAGDWAHEALPGGGHRFWLDLGNGIRLTKTFTPPEVPTEKDAATRYHFDVTVEVTNTTGAPVDFAYRLHGPAGIVDDSGDSRTGVLSAAAGVRTGSKLAVHTVTAADAQQEKAFARPSDQDDLTFFGLTTKYFAAVVLPREGTHVDAMKAKALRPGADAKTDPEAREALTWGEIGAGVAGSGTAKLAPNETRVDRFMVYVGPKAKVVFEEGPYEGRGLEKLIDFGWFEFMAKLLLIVLRGFHWAVGNWGVSILLLTFLVRSLLLPLSMWSQKNMLRMQKLAPELNKLKEKYARKDGSMTPEAQRQFSMEQMELMRKVGVNPIGCVGPIFLQLPVFIGLWNALNYSFELRGQPFVGWIHDLSVPEVLFRLPFTLPVLGTNAFSVLPMIMIFTYWLQQKLQPIATDPKAAEQQRMMKWIIPFFGLMLYTAPSGLMLYFITSSTWSMIEQKWVKKRIEAVEGPMPGVVAPMM